MEIMTIDELRNMCANSNEGRKGRPIKKLEKYGETLELEGGAFSVCPFCNNTIKILYRINQSPYVSPKTKCKHYKRIGRNAITDKLLVSFVEK